MGFKNDVTLRDLADLSTKSPMDTTTCPVVRVTASTTSHNVKLAAGFYKVCLRNADNSCHCYFASGADNTTAVTEPADTAHQGDASAATGGGSIRGDEIDRIYVSAAAPWIAYMLSSGAAASYELVFTKVV